MSNNQKQTDNKSSLQWFVFRCFFLITPEQKLQSPLRFTVPPLLGSWALLGYHILLFISDLITFLFCWFCVSSVTRIWVSNLNAILNCPFNWWCGCGILDLGQSLVNHPVNQRGPDSFWGVFRDIHSWTGPLCPLLRNIQNLKRTARYITRFALQMLGASSHPDKNNPLRITGNTGILDWGDTTFYIQLSF